MTSDKSDGERTFETSSKQSLTEPEGNMDCHESDEELFVEAGSTPSFKSIATDIKKRRLSQSFIQDKGKEVEEDEEFCGRLPVKLPLHSIARNGGASVGFLAESTGGKGVNNEKVQRSQGLRQEVFKILKEFFKTAFTIIVKRRRLCPSNAFHTVRILGVKVPRFLHPSSLEYVEEIAKKLLLFVDRNVTEGCVLHVMIEKNKTLYVVQRFVFRIDGSWGGAGSLQDSEEKYELENVKLQCKTSLLQLLNTDTIKPMMLPQFSRWSISIGLRNEFVFNDVNAFKEIWDADPSGNYFPWKERPKSIATANIEASRSQEHSESNGTSANGSQESFSDGPILTPYGTPSQGNNNLSQPNKDSSGDGNSNGTVCFPISTISICDGLLLSIYGLQYPAPNIPQLPESPLPNFVCNSNSSNTNGSQPATGSSFIRTPRALSVMPRIAQFRNRK